MLIELKISTWESVVNLIRKYAQILDIPLKLFSPETNYIIM